MNAVGVGIGSLAGGQDDPGAESGPQGVAELFQARHVGPGGPLVCLDLKGEDVAVVELGDEVDLGSVAGAPVS